MKMEDIEKRVSVKDVDWGAIGSVARGHIYLEFDRAYQ
jgi:hypothetical protein